ncbi:hypothetical protein EVAR_99108_1 [Eumeta japonica]|uniref:Uncharacterized protein n=1 Tax=Eumeta variegata TaxID=151549 RepID=A0A4C1Z6Z0_EUMVA|nr:hypothetical protein EVAR_99108_1 [Eumeta japonica]
MIVVIYAITNFQGRRFNSHFAPRGEWVDLTKNLLVTSFLYVKPSVSDAVFALMMTIVSSPRPSRGQRGGGFKRYSLSTNYRPYQLFWVSSRRELIPFRKAGHALVIPLGLIPCMSMDACDDFLAVDVHVLLRSLTELYPLGFHVSSGPVGRRPARPSLAADDSGYGDKQP